jgi:hypothetical protein
LLFERPRIAQVVVERQTGVIDEDVDRFDSVDSFLNLRGVGHVHGQGRDAPIRVGHGPAHAGVYPLRASAQGFLDQRTSDTAIGPSHQNGFVCHSHTSS